MKPPLNVPLILIEIEAGGREVLGECCEAGCSRSALLC